MGQTLAIPTSKPQKLYEPIAGVTYIPSSHYRWFELLDTGERILQQAMTAAGGGQVMWFNVSLVRETKEQFDKRTKG